MKIPTFSTKLKFITVNWKTKKYTLVFNNNNAKLF